MTRTTTIKIKPIDYPADETKAIAVYDEDHNPSERLLCIFPDYRAALSVICCTPNQWPGHMVWDYADKP